MRAPIIILIVGIFVANSAYVGDDCFGFGCLFNQLFHKYFHQNKATNTSNVQCLPIKAKHPSDSSSKIDITKPGRYCLIEDLHTRFEIADHQAEGAMIDIFTNDVVLDLQGHKLGRGRFLVNSGGAGIFIDQGVTNIKIMNGTLENFSRGVFKYENPATEESPIYIKETSAYHFLVANIVIQNVVFNNNKKDFEIRVPAPVSYDDNKVERRRKSQYPPCGGTDDFGRPLAPGQPCDDGK